MVIEQGSGDECLSDLITMLLFFSAALPMANRLQSGACWEGRDKHSATAQIVFFIAKMALEQTKEKTKQNENYLQFFCHANLLCC